VTLTIKGLSNRVLAVTDIWNQGSLARHPARPYVATRRPNAVAVTARKLGRPEADAVIVSYHGGVEYDDQPLPTRALANLVMDYGAPMSFLGHHPHVFRASSCATQGLFLLASKLPHERQRRIPETASGCRALSSAGRGAELRNLPCPERRPHGRTPRRRPDREAAISAFERSSARAYRLASRTRPKSANSGRRLRAPPAERAKARAAMSRSGQKRADR
jgi:poly-gamma-glutamate synthesis protein (capsule biosynthesis protein)